MTINRPIRSAVYCFVAVVGVFFAAAAAGSGITGALVAGQPLTLELRGPLFHENGGGNGNPFLDWRLLCEITQPDGQAVVVPGFFAGDGDAAHTHADSGNAWQVHFTPSQAGEHRYLVSLHEGPGVGIDPDPLAGSPSTHPASFHGAAGAFVIGALDGGAPGFLGQGMLRYVGEHHLRFDDGSHYLKGGAGSPENFLAFDGIDGTTPSHAYVPHAADWNAGDPDWIDEDGDSGRNLIGALNYLASAGMNSVYFLTMNVGGDGNDVWPWTLPTARQSYDLSKLAQWELIFSHMDRLGIQLHVLTQETENDQLLDGGALGVERKLYYKELVARFAHHNAVSWNLGEENTNTPAQRDAFCEYISAWDAYDHPITVHHFPHQIQEVYLPLLGNPDFDGTSLQLHPHEVHARTIQWIDASAGAGHPWVVCHDEQRPADTGAKPDSDDYWHDDLRLNSLWGNLIAGGGGVEYYFGSGYAHSDLLCEDWRSRDHLWELTRYALEFFQQHLPFPEMQHADGRVSSGWCLAGGEETFAVYLPFGGTTTLDLTSTDATFDVLWFDPRHGGGLQVGSVPEVSGPGWVSLGDAPSSSTDDWVVLVSQRSAGDPPVAVAGPNQQVGAGELVQFDGTGSHIPGGGAPRRFDWDFGDGCLTEDSGPLPVHAFAAPGVYPVTLTVTSEFGTDRDAVRIAVGTALLALDRFEDLQLHEWRGSPSMQGKLGALFLPGGGVANLSLVGLRGSLRLKPIDVAVQATIQLGASGAGWGGLAVRRAAELDPAPASGYVAFLRQDGTVVLHVGGVGTIASAPTGLDPTAAPVLLRIEAREERISVFVDGALYLDETETTFSRGFVAGVGHGLDLTIDDFRVESLAPSQPYGTGQTGSGGRVEISSTGHPSPGGGFRLRIDGLSPSSPGLLFRSTGPVGATGVPWILGDWYGFTSGATRLAVKFANGGGAVEYDLSEIEPAGPSETRCYQYWSRDAGDTVVSNALRVTFE